MYDADDAHDSPNDHQKVILINEQGTRVLETLAWGLIPYYTGATEPVIRPRNARAESLRDKDMFKAALQYRRCLIPLTSWIVHDRTPAHRPFKVERADGQPFAVAGIWEKWLHNRQTIRTCALVTVPANALILPIQDRMPALLDKEAQDIWLNHKRPIDEALAVLRPWPGEDFVAVPAITPKAEPPPPPAEPTLFDM